MKTATLKSPFPYFGGKSRVAPQIWQRFGDVQNYVEPFFGSGACLLAAPWPADRLETVNDADGFVANFWRALQNDPEAVAKWADWPVNENDLHARHVWLRGQREDIARRLEGDPDWFDAKVAGWWCWGLCCWIGGGWCGDGSRGPWAVVDGQLVHLGDRGQGVTRRLVQMNYRGVTRHIDLREWMQALADRLRRVRVCCGDWARATGPSVTFIRGLTAVCLDPPYDTSMRDGNCYNVDSDGISGQVREWAIENGDNPLLRIALCGYEGEHEMPGNWEKLAWKAKGGFGSQGNGRARLNATNERVWFSPHCLNPDEIGGLFS